jgi:hypothetical protein
MTTLADKVFSLMSPHFRREDTGQENDPAFQNRGTLQRIAEAFAVELDEHILPKIEELIAKTRLPASIVNTVVPLREQSLGLPAPLYDSMTNRKWLLPYLKRCMGHRGTLRNYIFLLGRLGFDVSIETATNDGMFDSGIFDNGFFDSYLDITGTFHLTLTKRYAFPTTPLLEAEIVRIIEWNKPINVRSYTYQIVGYEPIIGLSPAALAFGVVQVNGSATLSFDIENTGTAPLTVSSIDVPYPTYTLDWSSGVVAAESTQTVHVTYTPVASGAQDGDIVINSDATLGDNVLPVTAAGFVEIGLRLNGTSNYAIAPYNAATVVAQESPHTYSVLFRTAADNGQPNYVWHYQGYNSGMATYGNEFYFSKSNAGGGIFDQVKVTGAIQPNTLYHVVVVNTGVGAAGIKVYINGVQRTTVILSNGGATGAPTGALVLGTYIAGPYFWFAGAIYFYRLLNVAMSDAQVLEEYQTGFLPVALSSARKRIYEIQESPAQYNTLIEEIAGNHATPTNYTPLELTQSRVKTDGTTV